MKSFFLLVLLLSAGARAEVELDSLVSVRHSVGQESLKLVLETKSREPEASVFFLTGPDRLVVELNDTAGGTSLSGKPSARMVQAWSLKPSALNRCRLTLTLNYRPPSSEVKVFTLSSPPRLVVEIPTKAGVSERMALTEGITWMREDTFLDGRWTRMNRLLFDPADPNLEVVLGLAREKTDAREPLSSMVKRYGAVAGINGGFFAGTGGALGLVYREGRMLAPHVSRRPPRSGFGLTRDGKVLFGRIAATGTEIKDLDGGDWSNAWLALGGGPRLLQNGLARITADLEELGPKGNDITRVAARTVVGLLNSDELMFATVSGYRDNHREGTRFEPLVGWLKSLGVKEAVNFDGGASVDMVVGGHIVSDGPANTSKEKPVATALLVRDKRDTLFPETAKWSFSSPFLPADGAAECTVEVSLQNAAGKAVPDGTPVRFFGRGVLLEPADTVTQDGLARTTLKSVRNPGTPEVEVMAGPLHDERTFSLRRGVVERFMIQQAHPGQPTKDDPTRQRAIVKVQALDQWGNGAAHEPFACTVDSAATADFVTDERGMMVLEVELHARGGVFTIYHPSGTVGYKIPPLAQAE